MQKSRGSLFGAPVALATTALTLACAVLPVRAAEIDPLADEILRRMSDHLTGLQAFAFTTEVATDIIMRNGQKVQFVASGSGVFDRKQGFHFRRKGVIGDLELVYDGRNLTLYAEELNGYHTVQIEGGNDVALDEVRAAFGIEAAGGIDLLYTNPYDGLNYDVESGEYLGDTWIGGIRAHHLAYRAAEVDWQLWVSADGDPLPLRYVITSKWMMGAPQLTVQVQEWNSAVAVTAADVTFSAPEGVRALEAIEFDALGIAISE